MYQISYIGLLVFLEFHVVGRLLRQDENIITLTVQAKDARR